MQTLKSKIEKKKYKLNRKSKKYQKQQGGANFDNIISIIENIKSKAKTMII
jgi:hypothetical protein